jgi:hypothetical protein
MRGGPRASPTSGRCNGCSMNDSPQKPLREGGYRPIGGALPCGCPRGRIAVATPIRSCQRCRVASCRLGLPHAGCEIVIHRAGTGCFVCCGPWGGSSKQVHVGLGPHAECGD